MKPDSSATRKTTHRAISSGSPVAARNERKDRLFQNFRRHRLDHVGRDIAGTGKSSPYTLRLSQDVQRHFGADVLQGPYLRGEAAACPLSVCPAFLRDRLVYLASHLLNRRRPLLTALLPESLGARGDRHH